MNTDLLLSFIVWDANPDIFVIPGIDHPVRWYGLMWGLGFLFSQMILIRMYKKEGRTEKEIELLTVYIIIATILGARLGHCLFYNPDYYLQHPLDILKIWEGGLASHGAGLGIFLATYLFAKKTNVAYLWILDRLAIVVAFTGSLIRFGNLMNSEMIGTPTDVPWAFIFVQKDNIPRHPAQLYESIYCILLFAGLFYLWQTKRQTMKDGTIFSWFLIILFSLRIVDEFFKVNQETFEDGMILNMGQLLSIPMVLAGVAILIWNKMKSPPTPKEETSV